MGLDSPAYQQWICRFLHVAVVLIPENCLMSSFSIFCRHKVYAVFQNRLVSSIPILIGQFFKQMLKFGLECGEGHWCVVSLSTHSTRLWWRWWMAGPSLVGYSPIHRTDFILSNQIVISTLSKAKLGEFIAIEFGPTLDFPNFHDLSNLSQSHLLLWLDTHLCNFILSGFESLEPSFCTHWIVYNVYFLYC